jgi:hypothetical protein
MNRTLADPRLLYFSIAVTLGFMAWMTALSARYPEGAQERIVALEIAPDAATYRSILAGWLGDPPQDIGLGALRASFRVDFGFIAGYVLLLMCCLAAVRSDLPRWVFGAPILVGLLDIVENVCHLRLLGELTGGEPLPAELPAGLLRIASTASHGKWILFAGVSIVVLVLFIKNFREIRPWPRLWIAAVLLVLLAFSGLYFKELAM